MAEALLKSADEICREKRRAVEQRYIQKYPEKYASKKLRTVANRQARLEENRDKDREYQKAYRAANLLEVRAKINSRLRKKRLEDPNFKLAAALRTRLLLAIKHSWKAGSAVSDLGCSIAELKLHLEAQFLPNMMWSNHTKAGWHIDHIEPLANFDLTDRAQFLAACHYTNLQPLWAIDNLSKGARTKAVAS